MQKHCPLVLMFALHYYILALFYVIFEIDTMLDNRTISFVGHYLKYHVTLFMVISARLAFLKGC